MLGRVALGYGQEEELWVVLEEDGTEVSFYQRYIYDKSLNVIFKCTVGWVILGDCKPTLWNN